MDIRTLILIYAGGNILQALSMQYVRRVHADYPAARLWANGSLLLASGLMLLFLRGVVPPFVSIAIGNSLIMGGAVVINFGTAVATGRAPPWRWAIGLWLLFVALFIWAITLGRDVVTLEHRVLVFSLFGMLIQGYAVWVCVRVVDDALRPSF